ncbi:MAG: EAL domain-containing protein [Lachnospiraceae bacterium]|nr:EAL domain-containing protein [Lachnospiraceae bacterium]
MWDFTNVIPAICILTIFYIYCISRPHLPVRSKKIFIYLVVVEELTLITDIFATIADMHYAKYSIWYLYAINILYFSFFFIRIYLFYIFAMYVVETKRRIFEMKFRPSAIILLISIGITVLSIWTGWVFSIDNVGYHSGPLYNYVLYTHMFFYIFAGMGLVYLNSDVLKKNHFKSMQICFFVLFTGTLLRYFMPNQLIMDMFCVCAIIVIYLEFENAEMYLNSSTGLFNRHSFNLVLNEMHNIKQDYNLICFVIKDYQASRDMYGWRQIDSGLQLISNYMTDNFKDKTLFYLRNGAFAIITKENDAKQIRDKVKERFESTWLAEGTELFLYISFVMYDSKLGADTEDVISSVGAALIDASRFDNREDIVIDHTTIEKIERQIAVRKALDRAIEQNQIQVYLQPVVRASDYKVVGAEALARIIDPDIGFIPPNDFIPIAEMNGSITRLGKQVFEKTCEFVKKHMDEVGLEWVNVNLSPIQCMNKGLSEEFSEIVNRYGISVSKIHLEITEQSIIDSDILKSQMQIMVHHGFKFALDDYGSGYSNAISVVNYPLSNIKIDRGIIVSYFDKPTSLLPNEIKIFLDMDFSVTAEGVETKEMADKLKEFGCNFLQGFYFSKPLPMKDFVEKYRVNQPKSEKETQ